MATESVDHAVEMLGRRQVIEQAKGALMISYGLSADEAFDVLVWHSQQANLKLHAIAARILEELMRADRDLTPRGKLTAAVRAIYGQKRFLPAGLDVQ